MKREDLRDGPYYVVYWHTNRARVPVMIANICHVSRLLSFVRHRIESESSHVQVEGQKFKTQKAAHEFLKSKLHENGENVWQNSQNGVYITYPGVVKCIKGGKK